jgi:hypothetical protein
MNKKTYIIIGAIVILLLAIIFWPKKDKPDPYNLPKEGGGGGGGNASGGGSPNNGGGGGNPAPVRSDFPLKKGSKGEKVKQVQQALNYHISYYKRGRPLLKEDGVWGAATDAEVKRSFPDGLITEARYNKMVNDYAQGVPFTRFNATSLPVYIGATGDLVKRLNAALGLFTAFDTSVQASEYGASTEAAVKARFGKYSADVDVFSNLGLSISPPKPGVPNWGYGSGF